MGNGADVRSNVTSVHLMKDGTVQVNVRFDGFTAGEPVEITGYVTQTGGAYSSFYSYTTTPDPTPPDTYVTVPVTIDETIDGLKPSGQLTVVAKVTKAWPTRLKSSTPGTGIPKTGPDWPAQIGNIAATWTALPSPKGAKW